jgi:hypothetical protein
MGNFTGMYEPPAATPSTPTVATPDTAARAQLEADAAAKAKAEADAKSKAEEDAKTQSATQTASTQPGWMDSLSNMFGSMAGSLGSIASSSSEQISATRSLNGNGFGYGAFGNLG